jgi:two-component sensor histidine kinase
MAYLHELLYGSKGYSSVDAAKYIQLIVRGLSMSHGKHFIRVRAQPDNLSIDAAMPFGLIVSELLTNAIKYAYPENEAAGASGREILVSYRREGGERRLEVRDEGLGLLRDQDGANASMGLPLVRGLAEQLGGRLFLEEAMPGNPRPGLKAILLFPDPEAAAT